MNREGWAFVGDDCLVQVAGKSSHLSVLVWERLWALDDCKTTIQQLMRPGGSSLITLEMGVKDYITE